mgnify:CR=1 FL=1
MHLINSIEKTLSNYCTKMEPKNGTFLRIIILFKTTKSTSTVRTKKKHFRYLNKKLLTIDTGYQSFAKITPKI